jgi:flagellar motor switch protein FliN/FliY
MSSIDPTPSTEVPSVHVISFAELDALAAARSNGGAHTPAATALAGPFRQIQVKLTVRVGEAQVSVGELLDAKAGQVIRLDSPVDHPVDLLLDGQVVARGTLVAVEDRFGVRITELPLALDLSGGAAR